MLVRGSFDGNSAVQFLKAIKTRRFAQIGSLVWKDKRGIVHDNVATEKSSSTNINIAEYYAEAIAQKLRYRCAGGVSLLRKWLMCPSVSIYKKTGGAADFRTPEDVYFDIVEICRFSPCDVLIKGDIRLPGRHFAERLLSLLQHKTVANVLVFEISAAADAFYMREIARSIPRFRLNIAPGSHDETLREKNGISYSNADLESTIAASLKVRPVQSRVLFLTGLPGQAQDSLGDTVGYCEYLLRRFDGDKRLNIALALCPPPPDIPLQESLERYGYFPGMNVPNFPVGDSAYPGKNKKAGRRKAGMDAEQIALSAYDSLIKLARLENKYGQLQYREAEIMAMDYESGMKMTERLYRAAKSGRYEEIAALKPEVDRIVGARAKKYAGNAGSLAFSRPQNALALCRAVINNHPLRAGNAFNTFDTRVRKFRTV
jgi:hypothetical protein